MSKRLVRRSIDDLTFAVSLSVVWGEVLVVSIYMYVLLTCLVVYTPQEFHMCTFHSVVLLLLKDLESVNSSTTVILQSMSVKRTVMAVRVYVWIHSIPLSVAVMLDIC